MNPVFVFLVIGEVPSLNGLIGFGAILAGMILMIWIKSRKRLPVKVDAE
jgi:drug/metabolite transporter (DMT)-like permease